MTLWILQNDHAAAVLADLSTICPDPGLSIDGGGRIYYTQTISSVGCNVVAFLASHAVAIGVRGEQTDWAFKPSPGGTLRDAGGIAKKDKYPGTQQVDIVYDVTNCNGVGTWVTDAAGNPVPNPTHVKLFHELAHAVDYLQGTYDPADRETSAIARETQYRQSVGLPGRVGHGGGCYIGPAPPPGGGPPPPPSPATLMCPAVSLVTFLADSDFGTDHTPDDSEVTQDALTYRVNINNQSTSVFDQIVIFYNRVGQDGVVFLQEVNVQPGEVRGFVLGQCDQMESYVVGFFIGDNEVAKFPDSGNMTPALAQQLHPTAPWCVNSWSIS
jgi:NleD-like pathogen effector protein (putative zinc metallopeptidase)